MSEVTKMSEIKIEIGDTELSLYIKNGNIDYMMVSTNDYMEDILIRGKSFAVTKLDREPHE